ncbi:aliphatic nitrilase [Fusarium oxysporum f. sp. phaseoli]
MSVTTSLIKAAVIQAEPVWFDLAGTVTKTCHLIKDAASKGAHIIAFPELWLPGYPAWIWESGFVVRHGLASLSTQVDLNHTPSVAAISRVYSIQAQCYTLHSTTVISEPSIDMMGTKQAAVFNVPGGGNARIFAPDGRQLTSELPATEEGMVLADLDLDQVTMHKAILDTCGHNGRPELLWLGRNNHAKPAVRTDKDLS